MALHFASGYVRCGACGIEYDAIAAAMSDKDEIPCAYYPGRHVPDPADQHPLVPAIDHRTGDQYPD